MTDLVPSFILKANRAEQHLKEIKGHIAEYRAANPYTVGIGREHDDRHNVRTLVFKYQPSYLISLLIGEFVHNIRSGCDHLAAAMSLPKHRDQSQFPIVDKDPWEIDPTTGDHFKGRKRSLRLPRNCGHGFKRLVA